jgi:hypothetical protein
MLMKNSNDIIGNRTRDLSASSAVPQPTAPLRASELDNGGKKIGSLIDQGKINFVSNEIYNRCKHIGIGGNRFERVSGFSYLGSIIN